MTSEIEPTSPTHAERFVRELNRAAAILAGADQSFDHAPERTREMLRQVGSALGDAASAAAYLFEVAAK